MRSSTTRSATLALYARALRAARRCPTHDKRVGAELIARQKLEANRHEGDRARVQTLLSDGHEEVSLFESFLSVRESREKVPSMSTPPPLPAPSSIGADAARADAARADAARADAARAEQPAPPLLRRAPKARGQLLSIYELLARANTAVHGVDTARGGGRAALESLLRVSTSVDRAAGVLAAAQAAAIEAVLQAEQEVMRLEEAAAGHGVGGASLRGARGLRDALLASRAALQSTSPGPAVTPLRVAFVGNERQRHDG